MEGEKEGKSVEESGEEEEEKSGEEEGTRKETTKENKEGFILWDGGQKEISQNVIWSKPFANKTSMEDFLWTGYPPKYKVYNLRVVKKNLKKPSKLKFTEALKQGKFSEYVGGEETDIQKWTYRFYPGKDSRGTLMHFILYSTMKENKKTFTDPAEPKFPMVPWRQADREVRELFVAFIKFKKFRRNVLIASTLSAIVGAKILRPKLKPIVRRYRESLEDVEAE